MNTMDNFREWFNPDFLASLCDERDLANLKITMGSAVVQSIPCDACARRKDACLREQDDKTESWSEAGKRWFDRHGIF